MKQEPCIGAVSSAAEARSSACMHGSHILTGRTADPRSPRASAAGAHIRRLMRMKLRFARLNLPTAADIDALMQQVAELEAHVNQLNKQ